MSNNVSAAGFFTKVSTASSTELAGKSTLTCPSDAGVISTTYELPLPVKFDTLPLVITKSESSKPLTSRLKNIFTGMGFSDVGLLASELKLTVNVSTVRVVLMVPAFVFTLFTVALIAELTEL